MVIVPFNDIERARAILDANKGQIACVLLDLIPHRVGLRPADQDFVDFIREWTTKENALLVLDEVITFRSTYSGAQGWYHITPEFTAMGQPPSKLNLLSRRYGFLGLGPVDDSWGSRGWVPNWAARGAFAGRCWNLSSGLRWCIEILLMGGLG